MIEKYLEELKKPLKYQWKIQSFNKEKTKASCVAYIDARDLMERLDNVLGMNWSCDYKTLGDTVYCGIGIYDGVHWIFRWDAGGKSDIEEEKGTASDAFKRAGVKWGVGRFLYDLEIKWIDIAEGRHPIDKQGKRIYDLTKYFEESIPHTARQEKETKKEIKDTIADKVKENFNPDYDMLKVMQDHLGYCCNSGWLSSQVVINEIKLQSGKPIKFMELNTDMAQSIYRKCIDMAKLKNPELEYKIS